MSKLFHLNVADWVKASVIAILTPVAGYVGQLLTAFSQGGSFAPDWTTVWHLALAGAVAYLTKQFLTNSQGVPLTGEPKVYEA
jgi:hypothetical protein